VGVGVGGIAGRTPHQDELAPDQKATSPAGVCAVLADARFPFGVDNAQEFSANPKRLYVRAGNGRSVFSIEQHRVICPKSRARTVCAERRWADYSIR
jgi:hypothetical protein